MNLTLDDNASNQIIRAYQPGRVQINERWITSTVLVYPHRLDVTDWPTSIDLLEAKHLDRVVQEKISVVLIGTGEKPFFPEPHVYAGLLAKKIGVEIMDTRAACRTFHVLSAEGRAVGALLFL